MLSIESQSILYVPVGLNARNNTAVFTISYFKSTELLNSFAKKINKRPLPFLTSANSFFKRQKLLNQVDQTQQ